MLGYRPYPEQQESLTGYLLRLAYTNGLVNIYELSIAIGIDKPKVSRFGIWSEQEIENYKPKLGAALGRNFEPEKLICQHPHNWVYNESAMIKELRVDFARICPHCLVEHAVIDWRWSIGTIARCKKHKVKLIDTCPKCKNPLLWNASLFECCKSCGYSWHEHVKNSDPYQCYPFSMMESALYPDENGDILAATDFLEYFCAVMIGLARPYDLLWQSIQRIPHTSDHSSHVENTMALIECESHQKYWEQRWLAEWECGFHVQSPVRTLIKSYSAKFANFESTQIPLMLKEKNEYLRPSRKRLINPDDKKSGVYHVNQYLLAQATQLSKQDLLMMMERSIFPVINGTKVTRDQLFDLRKLSISLEPFYEQKDDVSYIFIAPDDKLLKAHLCKYGELLADVFEYKIHGYLPNQNCLKSLCISKLELETWLIGKLHAACSLPRSIMETARALGCNTSRVLELVAEGKLKWAGWQRGVEKIDGASLLNYIETTPGS